MAPIFASPDITALVAAFPPPLPTRGRPSLVKSNSGNLVDSRKVLAKFRVLLETSPGRIKKTDLPSKLGIERSEWLLECYEGEILYGNDLQNLIPAKGVQDLRDRLQAQAAAELLEIGQFASRKDVSRQSLNRIIASISRLRHIPVNEVNRLVGDHALVERIKERIYSGIEHADGEKVDLLSSFNASVPAPALFVLAEEALQERNDGGSLSREGESVFYVPADYASLQTLRQAKLHQAKVESALNDLATDGFCELFNDSSEHASQMTETTQTLSSQVIARFQESHGDEELTPFDRNETSNASGSRVVAKQAQVDKAMEELQGILQNAIQKSDVEADPKLPLGAVEKALEDQTSYLGLTQCLLRSAEHRGMLESTLSSTSDALADEKSRQFEKICQDSLLAPLELYSKGLDSISDETLKERLNPYICEHFRNELVPDLTQRLDSEHLLRDKARAKEWEKLTSTATQAKNVAEMQSAAIKFCRKLKNAVPDTHQLRRVKYGILEKKLGSVQKMTRPSDVLQNLTWISLAQEHDGLFISSGKDTSRMIKVVGDAEQRQKLERWRDRLKAGSQSDEDLQQMKDLASEVVEGMLAGIDTPQE